MKNNKEMEDVGRWKEDKRGGGKMKERRRRWEDVGEIKKREEFVNSSNSQFIVLNIHCKTM